MVVLLVLELLLDKTLEMLKDNYLELPVSQFVSTIISRSAADFYFSPDDPL